MKTTYKEVTPFTTERLLITIDKALEFAIKNDFQIYGAINASYKQAVIEKINTASFSMKKKINKVLSRFEYRMTRKTCNLLFNFINKRLELNIPIKFKMSKSESDVIDSRENYKLLRNQLEEARVKYKMLKKTYYGSNKITTEYMEK